MPLALAKKLAHNLDSVKQTLGEGETFDLIIRDFTVAGKDVAFVFFDGLVNGDLTSDVIRFMQRAAREDVVPSTIEKLLSRVIPYLELSVVETMDEFIDQVLAGPVGVLVDGEQSAIILDLREYPVRSIEEPDLERVTRGSKEGFVETVVFNTALIRRRLRDPQLRFEQKSVGQRTKSDVIIAYVGDLVDPDVLRRIRQKIDAADPVALPLGAKSLQEYIVDHPMTPVPTVRFTERPDVAVAHLLEGHVLVMVDTTPMAMILPATFWHFTQHAEEFFQTPVVGTYLRLVRLIGMVAALVLTPLWLALYTHKSSLPQWLQFIGPEEGDYVIAVALQFLILELGADLIRMALIHTPNALSTSLGIVGAILLGDLAIDVGLFIPETILYMAVALIGYFAIPTLEFGNAVRLGRYALLAAAAFWGLPGLAVTLGIMFIWLSTMKSMGTPYMWPLVPLAPKALFTYIFRYPVPALRNRTRR